MKGKKLITEDSILKHNYFILNYAPLNYFYGKEVYFSDGFKEDKLVLFQLLGNLGAFANDSTIDNSISIFVLSDTLFIQLKAGYKDNSILYIEKKLNSKGQPFSDLLIITESSLITFIKKRTIFYYDEATQDLIE